MEKNWSHHLKASPKLRRRNDHRAQYGPNELTEKKTNLFLKFLSYFWGPIPWMIEGAVILSGVVGRTGRIFSVILLLLVAILSSGFGKEKEASNAIEALTGQTGSEGAGEARWQVDQSTGA